MKGVPSGDAFHEVLLYWRRLIAQNHAKTCETAQNHAKPHCRPGYLFLALFLRASCCFLFFFTLGFS